MSLAPLAPYRGGKMVDEVPEQCITIGYCLKTVKVLKLLQQDYIYKRYFKVDSTERILRVHKEQNMSAN